LELLSQYKYASKYTIGLILIGSYLLKLPETILENTLKKANEKGINLNDILGPEG